MEYFGEESFDVIISTEVLEHVRDWRAVINNMKRALREGGVMYITTRSFGFPYHDFPYDFWRYEIEDMRKIFSDFNIMVLKKDPSMPGVFLKARKPEEFKPNDLSDIALYSIILGKRTRKIPSISEIPLGRKISLKLTTKVSHLVRYLINKLSYKYIV
ncbi:MAG: methyltransferase domain-containing protein [Desulfurococcaceae archaeon]